MPKKTETKETKYEKGQLYDLPITDLKPDENQPRKHMDTDRTGGLERIHIQARPLATYPLSTGRRRSGDSVR